MLPVDSSVWIDYFNGTITPQISTDIADGDAQISEIRGIRGYLVERDVNSDYFRM